MAALKTLEAWLHHAESLTKEPIELGLSRMKTMIARLAITFPCPVFTVAGTNGKGSTCAMLNAILLEAGYHVGMHTSPHLLRFNERAVIDGCEVEDEAFIEAFEVVEKARGGMPLTYFEFTGLAILWLFSREKLDAVILEIGLGGRLDAMNAIDTSCGIVCAIGIDHTAYLGATREAIAYEKACIYRPGVAAVLTDTEAPETLLSHAAEIGAKLLRYGLDFESRERGDIFDFASTLGSFEGLPLPSLEGANQIQNACGVIAALLSLSARLPIERHAIEQGLKKAYLPARFERIRCTSGVELILDVGHNPQAASVLRANLERAVQSPRWAVFGMLRDKDMESVSRVMAGGIEQWFIASLTGPRAASAEELASKMCAAGIDMSRVSRFDDVASALEAALKAAPRSSEPVKIVVFGSFVTVAAAKRRLDELLL